MKFWISLIHIGFRGKIEIDLECFIIYWLTIADFSAFTVLRNSNLFQQKLETHWNSIPNYIDFSNWHVSDMELTWVSFTNRYSKFNLDKYVTGLNLTQRSIENVDPEDWFSIFSTFSWVCINIFEWKLNPTDLRWLKSQKWEWLAINVVLILFWVQLVNHVKQVFSWIEQVSLNQLFRRLMPWNHFNRKTFF